MHEEVCTSRSGMVERASREVVVKKEPGIATTSPTHSSTGSDLGSGKDDKDRDRDGDIEAERIIERDENECVEGQSDVAASVDRVSMVCLACLLFLRHIIKSASSAKKSEKEAAVFAANTSAFLVQKIDSECGGSGAAEELQHKLSMLFVLCQTCTQSTSSGA